MPRDYRALPPNEVRRKDRAVSDDAWIRTFLQEAPYGVLATVDDGQPFLNSNLFVYDEQAHALYLHTAHVGRTHDTVAAQGVQDEGAPVCFSAFRMGRLLPAPQALEFSVEYAGVVVFGTVRLLGDPEGKRHALQMLLDKYAPHLQPERDYRPITAEELARTAVYRIEITSWSGKKKEAAPDFPGAFLFGGAGSPEAR